MNNRCNAGLLFSTLIIATFLFAACNESSVNTPGGVEMEIGENYTFYKNEEMAQEASVKRSEEISDSFEIDHVSVQDVNGQKLMQIEVTQAMGCEDSYSDKFGVIWNGIMLMIYPPQVGLFLTFDSSGCTELEENVKETITLNLYDIFEDKEFVDDVGTFTIVNSSKTSHENDYEVSE